MKRRNFRKSSCTIDCFDPTQRFVQQKLAMYMNRILIRYGALDDEIFDMLGWLLGPARNRALLNRVSVMGSDSGADDSGEETLSHDLKLNRFLFARLMEGMVRTGDAGLERSVVALIADHLKGRIRELYNSGRSHIEKRLLRLKKIFGLSPVETELCLFLFIVSVWAEARQLFQSHLESDQYSGRLSLAICLGATETEIAQALRGKLNKAGILEVEHDGSISLQYWCISFLQNSSQSDFGSEFFRRVHPKSFALSNHSVDMAVTDHVLDLLKTVPGTSTHILLYGPPGTGKTSYAYGIGKQLGIPMYVVQHGGQEEARKRQAAITACVNMNSQSGESLVLADDCDVILETHNSWALFGQYPDRKWLHDLLETPGVRMIWIVNSIAGLEESVMRRFSFSVEFKPFNRRERVHVWEATLRRHKIKRLFTPHEINQLATRFDLSPGIIDQAARKAVETGGVSKQFLHRSVRMSLEAHERVLQKGHRCLNAKSIDPLFTADGLNIKGVDPCSLLKELEAFSNYLKHENNPTPITMALLFHGPPGTGKTHFARYIAEHLSREVVSKRASDVFSAWVGQTEQNIRNAYEEAQRKEAVLIFDEADSFIFSRDMARHSWELSFSNEFLRSMEDFSGIQIFTTNRLADLDAASLRRFNHKLEFGYLEPEGAVALYRLLLAPLAFMRAEKQTEPTLRSLSRLTPGDFKVVRNRFAFRGPECVSHEALVEALRDEERLKLAHAGEKSVGFIP